jgi:hypothetical protein
MTGRAVVGVHTWSAERRYLNSGPGFGAYLSGRRGDLANESWPRALPDASPRVS